MKTFEKNDSGFTCRICGHNVEPLKYTSRDHCNKCLSSIHIDINPGDRAEECHGILEPIGIEIDSKKGYVIIFKCKKCGKIRKNKVRKRKNSRSKKRKRKKFPGRRKQKAKFLLL